MDTGSYKKGNALGLPLPRGNLPQPLLTSYIHELEATRGNLKEGGAGRVVCTPPLISFCLPQIKFPYEIVNQIPVKEEEHITSKI